MSAISGSVYFNIITTIPQCAPGDEITVEFISNYGATSNNYTASVSIGSLTFDQQATTLGNYPYATSSVNTFISGTVGNNTIIFNQSLSSFYQNYQQVPFFISGSVGNEVPISSSLYNRYGDVLYPFDPQFGDRIVLNATNGQSQIVTVYQAQPTQVNGVTTKLAVVVVPDLDYVFTTSVSNISTFLLVKRVKDEQNIILQFKKPVGQTSYGFLIPENINPNVLININSLQSSVQSQLLSTQANSGL